jgi:glycosyltransferase involved in cell wall biosynthesis
MVRVAEISVIVPAWNAAATLGRTLDALAAQDVEQRFEVIVVDDGSEDGTVEVARRADVRVVGQSHAGPGPARDRGVAESTGTVLAFTDADCVPAPGWLRAAVEALRGADVVQGAVRPDPGAERRPFDRTIWVDGEVPLYETANLLTRREVYDEIGGFEDWLGPVLGKPLAEDVWFGWRARRAGKRIAFAPQALVHHAVFRRRAAAYVAERARLAYFPAIVARIPELRRELLLGRLFLNRRTAAFDAAVAGAATALVLGFPLAVLAAGPYVWIAARSVIRWRTRAPLVVLVDLVADTVGFAALVFGSARRRSPVL